MTGNVTRAPPPSVPDRSQEQERQPGDAFVQGTHVRGPPRASRPPDATRDRVKLVRRHPSEQPAPWRLRPFDRAAERLVPQHVDQKIDGDDVRLELHAFQRVQRLDWKRALSEHGARIDRLDDAMYRDGLVRASVGELPEPGCAAAAVVGKPVFVDVDRSAPWNLEQRWAQDAGPVHEADIGIERLHERPADGIVEVAGHVESDAVCLPFRDQLFEGERGPVRVVRGGVQDPEGRVRHPFEACQARARPLVERVADEQRVAYEPYRSPNSPGQRERRPGGLVEHAGHLDFAKVEVEPPEQVVQHWRRGRGEDDETHGPRRFRGVARRHQQMPSYCAASRLKSMGSRTRSMTS